MPSVEKPTCEKSTAEEPLDLCPLCGALPIDQSRPSERDKVAVQFVEGVEGPSIYLKNFRIAGRKPWGGGTVKYSWTVPLTDIDRALRMPELS